MGEGKKAWSCCEDPALDEDTICLAVCGSLKLKPVSSKFQSLFPGHFLTVSFAWS